MEPEIRIPINHVPPEIVQKLKEIGFFLQLESAQPPATSATSKGLFGVSKKEVDECDDLQGSGTVVHVLGADRVAEAKKDSDVVSLFDENKDCSVVSVLDPRTEGDADSAYDVRKDSDAAGSRDRSDVVSVFDVRLCTSSNDNSSQSSGGARPVEGMQAKENEVSYENRSSPQKDHVNQNPRSFQQHAASPLKSASPVRLQSGQQYSSKMSYPNPHEASDYYTLHSQQQQQQPCSSPFKPLSCMGPEFEEDRCAGGPVVVGGGGGGSPCKTPKRYEDTARQHHLFLHHRPNHLHHHHHHGSDSPSMSELTSFSSSSSSGAAATTATTTSSSSSSSLSSSSQSFRSRLSPSPSCSNDDDLLRGVPAGSVTPSAGDVGQKSPRVLTPPETPENDGKRMVPEIFTFDDFACAQERLRQTWERLYKEQSQQTPTKRSPSTPRTLPPSTPPTPSYRRQEPGPPSSAPPMRHISPVDSHFLQRMEVAPAPASPQPKLKTSSDLPASPTLPATPHRLSVMDADFSSVSSCSPQRQRLDSLSPKPKKRLSFDEEGSGSFSHPMLQAQQQPRSRPYDPSAAVPVSAPAGAYPLPSPRPSGSGSEGNGFPFTPYSMDGQQQQQQGFGRGMSPGKTALSFAELHKKAASLAAFHEGRESDDDDERGAGPFISSTRHIYESIEFQNQLAMQNGRYTPKRKRSELHDGSDDMALCTCAEMKRNFLQMAECAYKRIRRMDATPADFERFRNELAQTNDILRESMGLMKQIRDLCENRKRPRW